MHIPQDISALHMYHQHHYQRLSNTIPQFCTPFFFDTQIIFAVRCGMRRLLLAASHLEAYKMNRLAHLPLKKKILCCFNKSRKCLMAIRSSFTSINAEKKFLLEKCGKKKKKK